MMHKMMVYKVRADGVFDGEEEIEVENIERSPVPPGYTRTSPHPIPESHYAAMYGGGWKYLNGEKPSISPVIQPAPAPTKEQLMGELAALTAKIQALE